MNWTKRLSILIIFAVFSFFIGIGQARAQGDVDINAVVDNQNPTITITNPSNGATVSGIVGVTTNANDDGGIVKVEFYVAGFLKLTDTTAPYTYSWDTMIVSNASHTISATVYDIANKTATDTITVTVNNITMTSPTKKLTPLGPVTPTPGEPEKEKPRGHLIGPPITPTGLLKGPIDFIRANTSFFFGFLFALELLLLFFLIKKLRERKKDEDKQKKVPPNPLPSQQPISQ